MDRVPPARTGPRFEMSAIGRSLADVYADDKLERESQIATGLVALASGLALIALVAWFVIG